ncbi:hypothetical protein B1R32_102122 [Abditibacterium utsteinense]|uniref:Lipoprotein n=1 Tax=Abditibacterium utsteinense TaxID=1960156 RepID=A0A2S8SWD0_9BACT|nr:hypothetical protein [Abditibacterium utsteinense]PQV65115.1 hypothetical protein B1R32_102122 [Abditibacterium utsteinense]
MQLYNRYSWAFCAIALASSGCSTPPPLAPAPAQPVAVATPVVQHLASSATPRAGSAQNPIVDGTPLSQHATTGGNAYAPMTAGPFDPNLKESVQETVETTFINPNNLPQIDPTSQKISKDAMGRTTLETIHRYSQTGKVVISNMRLTPIETATTLRMFGVIYLTNQSIYPATDLQIVFFETDLPSVVMSSKTLEADNPTRASPLAPGETRKVNINALCQLKRDGVIRNQRLGVEAQIAGPPGLSVADIEVRPVDFDAATGNQIGGGRNMFNGTGNPR